MHISGQPLHALSQDRRVLVNMTVLTGNVDSYLNAFQIWLICDNPTAMVVVIAHSDIIMTALHPGASGARAPEIPQDCFRVIGTLWGSRCFVSQTVSNGSRTSKVINC